MTADPGPAYRLGWRLIVRARNRRKLDLRVEGWRALYGALDELVVEPYDPWPDCWDAAFGTAVAAGAPAAVAFACLTAAARLGNGWYVLGPLVQGERLSVFSGVFDVRRGSQAWAEGLLWGSFDLLTVGAPAAPAGTAPPPGPAG